MHSQKKKSEIHHKQISFLSPFSYKSKQKNHRKSPRTKTLENFPELKFITVLSDSLKNHHHRTESFTILVRIRHQQQRIQARSRRIRKFEKKRERTDSDQQREREKNRFIFGSKPENQQTAPTIKFSEDLVQNLQSKITGKHVKLIFLSQKR